MARYSRKGSADEAFADHVNYVIDRVMLGRNKKIEEERRRMAEKVMEILLIADTSRSLKVVDIRNADNLGHIEDYGVLQIAMERAPRGKSHNGSLNKQSQVQYTKCGHNRFGASVPASQLREAYRSASNTKFSRQLAKRFYPAKKKSCKNSAPLCVNWRIPLPLGTVGLRVLRDTVGPKMGSQNANAN